jgi:16S rRNA (uracil1498-N3)-methyltransferase
MPHRFFLPSIFVENETVVIQDKKTICQISKVLRLKKNDVFIIFSNVLEYELIIKEINPRQIVTAVLDTRKPSREPKKRIILYQSLLKKDKFEWILQKGTELGISAFVPIISGNSVVREISPHKLQRYLNIIKEATEQCGGQKPAELKEPVTFENAIQTAAERSSQKIIAWEGESNNKLSEKIDKQAKEYHLFIGPEGGFSPQEIEIAKTNNFIVVSLGQRILRAETAAIAATSIILLS